MNVSTTDPVGSPQTPIPVQSQPSEKNAVPPEPVEEGPECDEFDYNPIPPRRVIKVQVRYVHQGRGLPLPYELDDDVSE